MADIFSQLFACSFRGIVFPVGSFRTSITQDIAQHKRPDRDGARLEGTGRNPLTFSATCMFRNGIAPGKNESLGFGVLYPESHRKFLAAMSDRSTGDLQHPSLGIVKVKPASCSSGLSAGIRDGEDVEAEWIEDPEAGASLDDVLAASSPISSVELNAIDLDGQVTDLGLSAQDPDSSVSFEEAARQITGVFDKATLLSKKFGGKIDALAYRASNLASAIDSLGEPSNWPAKQAAIRLADSLAALKNAIVPKNSDVRFYVTPGETTLAAVAIRFKNTVTEIIELNAGLVATAALPPKTIVRYYARIL